MKIRIAFLESRLAECIKGLKNVAIVFSEFPFQVYLKNAQIDSRQGMSMNVNRNDGY